MKSRFEKTFKEQGASFLSQKNVGMLKVVASRYEKYSEFFDGLAREVSTTEVKAELRELAGAAKTVSSNLNDVVNGNAVLEEISSLFDNMDFIRSKVAFYQTSAKKDEVFRKELEKYEKQSSTDLGEIAKVNAQIENKIKGLGEKRRGPLQYLKDVAPGLYETGAGIGGAMTDAFLGPFSDIGKMAIGGTIGIAKDIRKGIIERREKKLATGLTGIGAPPKEVQKTRSMLKETGTPFSSQIASGLVMRKQSVGNQGIGQKIASTIFPKLGNERTVGVTDLFTFFNRGAFRARWTKDIHSMLKKGLVVGGAGAGAGFFGGMLKGLFGKLSPALSLLGKALPAVGLTLMAGKDAITAFKDKAGEWFGKEKASFGERIAASVGGIFGGTGKGVGEKGATKGGVFKQALWGIGKGAAAGGLIGAGAGGIGAIPGAVIGGVTGLLTHLLGGRRLAKAASAVYRLSPIGMMTESIKGIGKGVGGAEEIFGLGQGKKATLGQKVSAGFSGMVSGLSAGKINTNDFAKQIHGFFSSISKQFPQISTAKEILAKIPMMTKTNELTAKALTEVTSDFKTTMSSFLASYKNAQPNSLPMPKQPYEDIYKDKDFITDSINMA